MNGTAILTYLFPLALAVLLAASGYIAYRNVYKRTTNEAQAQTNTVQTQTITMLETQVTSLQSTITELRRELGGLRAAMETLTRTLEKRYGLQLEMNGETITLIDLHTNTNRIVQIKVKDDKEA